MEWSEEKSLALIEVYKNYIILWDPKDEKYHNKSLKEDAWTEIGRAMDLPGTVCKNKMKILLSGFRREKAKENKSKGTGKGASEIYRSQWFAYAALSFLMDRNKPRKTLDAENSVATTSEQRVTPPAARSAEDIASTPPLAKRKFDPKLTMLKDAFGILKSASTKPAEDEISSSCKFLEYKLRGYDNVTKNLVQHELGEVIFKVDSGYFNPGYYTTRQYYNYVTTEHQYDTRQPPNNEPNFSRASSSHAYEPPNNYPDYSRATTSRANEPPNNEPDFSKATTSRANETNVEYVNSPLDSQYSTDSFEVHDFL